MKKRKRKTLAIAAAIAAVLVIWIVWDNTTLGVTPFTVVSGKLPSSFHHFKIAVVSDLHNAEFGKQNNRLIECIKEESPDLIAITGDLVDSRTTDIDVASELARRLIQIAPCCYVTGNHEAWLGEQYDELEDKLSEAGVELLHDRVIQLTKGGETIQLAGLDDPDFTGRDSSVRENSLETRLSRLELTDDYCILLSHRPEAFDAYVSEGVDLVLSGHAHGGQFRLPFIGGIVAPNQGWFPKYDAGVFSEGETTMIVSRGIGNSVIPLRINNRPELVIVELLREA